MADGWVDGGLRWIERLLVVAAAVCLSWVYVTWKEATFYQLRARSELAAMRATAVPPHEGGRPALIEDEHGGRDDSLIGLLEIPRVDLSVAVLEGDDDRTLRIAVGHLPDTPLPWEHGNSALAGHRDTFFRPLEGLRVGDEMRVVTRHGEFPYRVRHIAVVGPNDVEVLNPLEHAGLTLITCYPFAYVGSAPQRFIVQAERITRETGISGAAAAGARELLQSSMADGDEGSKLLHLGGESGSRQ